MINGELALYIELAKKAKMQNAIICDNKLIGLNGYCVVVIDIPNSQNWRFGFNVATAVQEVKSLTDNISFISNHEAVSIYNMYMNVLNLIQINNISNYPNILENERFSELINRKTKMGASMFTIDNIAFSIYSGLLPLNKSDALNLQVYHISNEFDLINFIIYKKKEKVYINQYMKVLKV